jgi:signal transduction histidine kinase
MLTDRPKESFSFKVFRSFAVSILIVFAAFTALFVYYENRTVRKDLYKEGKMLADLLAYNARTWVFAENRDMLKDAVQGIMGQKNVLAVAIYNVDKKALLIETRKSQGHDAQKSARFVAEAIALGPAEKVAEPAEKEDTIDFLSPVYLETYRNADEALYFGIASPESRQSVIGYVKVILDKDILRQEMKVILFRNALIALVFLCVGSLAIYIAIRRATMPLTRLAASVRSLGKGETIEKVPVESMDEIGRLAVDFNTMYDDLRKREEEKEALEERLRYAQKMEAIGTLARGIAHDFNNILATLRGSIYLMEKKLQKQVNLRQYTARVHNSITKGQNLIRGLLAFSKTQTINSHPMDINNIIRDLRPMLLNIAGEDIGLIISLSEERLTVLTDRLQMEQVLMNLCSNARDAMPDGGVITISTKSGTVGEDSKSLSPGAYAVISVGDSGPGIDEKVKERIFEPYFTTKDVGKGTGLGLSIVYGIIERHKGLIEVDTEKGEGTKFTIHLPLLEALDRDAEDGGAEDAGGEDG